MKLAVLVAFVLAVGACPKPLPPAPMPTPDAADAAAEGARPAATCASLCQHETVLGCQSAKPTPHGATCVDVCLHIQASGVISWNLDCRQRALTCAAMESCER